MSINSEKIRNNISLVLMTTLLNSVVISDVKASEGGANYAAPQVLKQRLRSPEQIKRDDEAAAARADKRLEEKLAKTQAERDKKDTKQKEKDDKLAARQKAKKEAEAAEEHKKDNGASKQSESKEAGSQKHAVSEKTSQEPLKKTERLENSVKEFKGTSVDNHPGSIALAGTDNSNQKLHHIPGAAQRAMEEEKARDEAARQSRSKFAKLKDKVKSKSSTAAKNIKETASDTRKKLRLPGSIEEAKYNVKTNLSDLKKGTVKAAKNVRDTAKSAHESISNKINPKISPKEAHAQMVRKAESDDMHAKSIEQTKQNINKEMMEKEAKAKAISQKAELEAKNAAKVKEAARATQVAGSEAKQASGTVGKAAGAAEKSEGSLSKIGKFFGRFRP